MEPINLLKQRINGASNEELAKIIPHIALSLDSEQIDTVSFVFWLSFMTEQDLDQGLCKAWKMAKEYGSFNEGVIKIIKEEYSIDITKIDPDDPDYDPMKICFGDRIKIYERIFGTNSHVKLLRKVKNLRNDISHGRINELKYKGFDLKTKEGKQKILIDYFEIITQKDLGESLISKQLSESEKEEVKEKFKQWKKDMKYD